MLCNYATRHVQTRESGSVEAHPLQRTKTKLLTGLGLIGVLIIARLVNN